MPFMSKLGPYKNRAKLSIKSSSLFIELFFIFYLFIFFITQAELDSDIKNDFMYKLVYELFT